ncbi:hypothetical protein AXG93_1217s1340 [Marchantia polymorpha subsp. ruderalis]|uniref:Formamidopyrimidine-DNA glycosylase catalytic domain-containing protein n=1 Tax=Marchantia polymorpha subsp. ruderalis TaxID=1480154 RepID=A0A176VUF0_MARPO|nr:hypothetical protein AXG93_1217s1340 [Marchantia polymorpha subsp. ruderalis]
MVEGPGVHRVAIAHRRVLLGRFFTNHRLENAALEKLPEDVIVVHIHFGMSGSFRTFKFPGPEPREKTRLRLENEAEDVVAHLSSSVCVHGGMELYRKRLTELGPDPLRDDADKEIAWNKMQRFFLYVESTLISGLLLSVAQPSKTYGTKTCYACDACQPLIDGVEPRRKTFVDAVRSKGHEEEDDGPADTDTLNESPVKHGDESVPKRFENKKAPAKKAKTSTIAFRKRKVMDGKIVEHQALKDIPTGGLVDFPGSLDDLIWPSADPASLKGSPFINKSAEAFSFMRLPRSVAAQYGRVNQRKTVGHVAQTAEYLLPSITTVGQGCFLEC